MKNDIYTLAHEIRNPLSVIKGYLEMLNENNIFKYKEIINSQINDSLSTLNDYLECNHIILNKEELDLNILLNDIKINLIDYLKSKNVYLHMNLLDDEIYLIADYNKLKQVLNNIIKNSVESNSKNINISYKIMFNKVTVIIKNDGYKIDNEALFKIGNYFTTKENGNGIGTTLIKKIISLHNGKIKYKNNKNKGVSVYITLSLS